MAEIKTYVYDTVPVTSGVPQGSVLGPCLFLLYINDLAQGLDSTVRLFADDTIAYMVIGDTSDSLRLQQDLDRLAHWEGIWQMQFHLINQSINQFILFQIVTW